MNGAKIISEKTILKTPLFTVKKLGLIRATGSQQTHYIAERIPIVSVFPLTKDYELYLVYQYRYLLKKVILEAVAGHVEKNEAMLTAAKRELKEETGITATYWKELLAVETGASAFRSKVHIFLARDLQIGKSEPDDGEEIRVIKMPLEKAVEMVLKGKIYHTTTIAGIFLLDKLRSENKL